ncbi:NADP-dependent 3-hydroxy acid dehydrogenase YdfG [Rhodobacter aestuarii]|uniref:NADP-dependent 3-hydroxy acid dehydrogenase YdfG n=1 Tax=Rhodobacter aestuarii TaxID=453582 RepID=A0A1N7JSA7_9RHOB|nr:MULTISPECIES: SDR family NAD(P)-dependent oxidoreductase [Rhodobacter]PTV96009.1 NADP-dependent 3-hydroxy acid dehydrogenase YdfG [Rhodobacter aestuarii]SIS52207.1 NADP-dependent 3-hydroxy acid dehydrogenase YdfG [Rhodobacter aestuarii]SOC10276.1 NADP-dependent 3-hydroxy acid dehydrogenase YdfG [Rhodobacter sp. JA431]
MSDKDQKIALISGANRGIGAAVVAGLSRAGVHVLLGCRDLKAGEEVAAPLCAEGGSVTPVQLDVTDALSVAALTEKLEADYGHIDILINNAGVGLDYVPGMSAVEKMEQTLAINVVGGLRLTEAMLPLLEKSAAPRIVNVSSELASFGLRHDPSWDHHDKIMPTYAASKAAVNALTVGYAKALVDKGFKVNAICPGYTATAATNFMPDRTVDQAAVVILQMALLEDDGPTGGFFNDQGALPW